MQKKIFCWISYKRWIVREVGLYLASMMWQTQTSYPVAAQFSNESCIVIGQEAFVTIMCLVVVVIQGPGWPLWLDHMEILFLDISQDKEKCLRCQPHQEIYWVWMIFVSFQRLSCCSIYQYQWLRSLHWYRFDVRWLWFKNLATDNSETCLRGLWDIIGHCRCKY